MSAPGVLTSQRARARAAGVLTSLAALALVVAVPSLAAATSAPSPVAGADAGSVGVRLIPVAGAENDPYITEAIAPGERVVRQISVRNTTRAALPVSLYAAGASVVDEAFTIADGRTASEASSYTNVAPGQVTIGPGESVLTTVTIDVPSDAAPGPQYAVVWAEVRSAASGTTGVTQVNRVGVRAYLTVGPGGLAPAAFVLENLTAGLGPDGQRAALATVRNAGGRTLSLSGTLALTSGPGGTAAGPFTAQMPAILEPGASSPVTVVLPPDLPVGPWTATLTGDAGPLSQTITAQLSFVVAAGPAAAGGASWWWFAALAGSLLALLLLVVLLRRRRQGAEPDLAPETSDKQSPLPYPRSPSVPAPLPILHNKPS